MVGHYMRWVYFRKKSADGPFDLFSDFESRIRHLKRIIALVLPITLLNLFCFFNGLRHTTLDWLPYLNLAAFLIGAFAIWRLWRRKRRYEKEREISES